MGPPPSPSLSVGLSFPISGFGDSCIQLIRWLTVCPVLECSGPVAAHLAGSCARGLMGLGRCCLGALCLLPSVPPLLLTGSPGTSSPRTVPCGACGSRLISCFSPSYSCGETETPAGPCGPAGFLARGYKGQQDMGRPAVGTAPGQGSLRLWRCRGWPGLCGLCAPRPPESGCLFPVVLASPARARAGGDTEAQRVHARLVQGHMPGGTQASGS